MFGRAISKRSAGAISKRWRLPSTAGWTAFRRGRRSASASRAGNGALDQLQQQGLFAPPGLRSLEEVLAYGLSLGQGRVFVDLWDVEMFCDCPHCGPARAERLKHMNLSQELIPEVHCDCEVCV